jgi:hypothetical protein
MRFAGPEDFRKALEHRLNERAQLEGLSVVRLRKRAAFLRFLVRHDAVARGPWVLKGGFALDLRLGSSARTSKDIDLARRSTEEELTEDFVAAQALDLDDHFSFLVERKKRNQGPAGTVSFTSTAYVGGREFEQFPIDVSLSDVVPENPDRIGDAGLFSFAGLKAVDLPLLPLAPQIAEKVHAYTRGYGAQNAISSRPKDLIDLVLMKRACAGTLDANTLYGAVQTTFETRGEHSVPIDLPVPSTSWAGSYANLATEVGLSTDLSKGHLEAADFLNPVLSHSASGKLWDGRAWVDPGHR